MSSKLILNALSTVYFIKLQLCNRFSNVSIYLQATAYTGMNTIAALIIATELTLSALYTLRCSKNLQLPHNYF